MIFLLAALAFQSELPQLDRQTQRRPSAATFRRLADSYVASNQFSSASLYFRKAADAYEGLGDLNAAKVLRLSAERYETVIKIFVETPHVRGTQKLARLEPENGCYVGAFIDREDAIERGFNADGQLHRDPQYFNTAVGKPHAVFFEYVAYGRPFPASWVSLLRRRGAAAHLAWEPKSYAQVQDDDYLHRFAAAARQSGAPIFLRFASEMNGDWTPYHSDPAAYRAMFYLVARVMHAEAPNVAMVWCPNEIPEDKIAAYYPGAGAVDWVGVNFYSVLFNDADRERGAEWRNPADQVRFVYERYSRLHPIMIGEWAASHLSVVDNQSRPEFAETKIAQLYAALPRLYPRLKSVQWLSMNTLKFAMPGRQLNDYSLLSVPSIAAAYSRAISQPWYLSQFSSADMADGGHPSAPSEYVAVSPGRALERGARLSAWVKTYVQRPSVTWTLNGATLQTSTQPGSYDFVLPKASAKGDRIGIVVRDDQGRIADRREIKL